MKDLIVFFSEIPVYTLHILP